MTSVETETVPCHLCFGKLLLQPNAHKRRGSIDCYHQLYKTPDMFCNSSLNSNNTTLWAKMSNERCQDECVPRFCAYGWFQFWDFLTVARNLSLKFWYKTRILKEQFESCAARTPSLNFLVQKCPYCKMLAAMPRMFWRLIIMGLERGCQETYGPHHLGVIQGILGHHH